jgi:hypothetical protein
VSDSSWDAQAGSRRGDGAAEDDWHLDDVDWFEETGRPSASPRSGTTEDVRAAGPAPGATPDRDTGDGPSALGGRSATIRRRRIAALAVLGALFVLALVIPLVVFSGGGKNAAEPTPSPATTPQTATVPARTTTQERPATTTTAPTTTQAAPLRVTLPGGTALKRGDSGSAVVQLQKGLAALGFAVGQPDGDFGATTEAAVVDFQQSNNLPPDGVVGTDTVRLLNAALARKSTTG